MSAVGAVLLVVLSIPVLIWLYAPMVREAIISRRLRQIRERRVLTEAHLKLMTYAAIQRMHQAAREQREDGPA